MLYVLLNLTVLTELSFAAPACPASEPPRVFWLWPLLATARRQRRHVCREPNHNLLITVSSSRVGTLRLLCPPISPQHSVVLFIIYMFHIAYTLIELPLPALCFPGESPCPLSIHPVPHPPSHPIRKHHHHHHHHNHHQNHRNPRPQNQSHHHHRP